VVLIADPSLYQVVLIADPSLYQVVIIADLSLYQVVLIAELYYYTNNWTKYVRMFYKPCSLTAYSTGTACKFLVLSNGLRLSSPGDVAPLPITGASNVECCTVT